MNPELTRFHSILNSADLVPAAAYRRNKVTFELLTYVNCLLGCVLSQRRDVIPVWIRRCRELTQQHPPQPEWQKYCRMVQDYMTEVEREFKFTAVELELGCGSGLGDEHQFTFRASLEPRQ